MPVCSKCQNDKPKSQFYIRPDRPEKVQSYCKNCFNQFCMERWKQKKIDAIIFMGGKCTDCKQIYHPNVYEFHHIGQKDYNWTKMRLRSWNNIKKELSKCVMLCANCHRLRHVDEGY